LQIEKDFKGVIERGTPIVQVIPFKRENYKMELMSPEESNKALVLQRLQIRSRFKNFYRDHMRQPKEYK